MKLLALVYLLAFHIDVNDTCDECDNVAMVLFDAIDCTARWADEVTEEVMKWDESRGLKGRQSVMPEIGYFPCHSSGVTQCVQKLAV